MNILFCILPLIVSVFVVIIKRKIVNAQNGKKFAKREMLLDIVKVIIIALIAVFANIIIDKIVPIWTLSIDLFMLIVYISPLFQKDYDYIGRKALMGIWSTFILMIILAITIWRMLIGTYSNEDATLFYCFVKAVSYFFIAVWVCFTTGKKNKIRTFFVELKSSFKTYQINILDYYMLAFLALFIFSGANNNVAPIGIFGIHEILNKKNIKGIIYIILGNLCIFLNFKTLFIGYIFYVLYTLVALVDLFFQFLIYRKKRNLDKIIK